MAIKEKTTGFISEFKTFIARGNVLDMAVGVIIGGAFGKISTSLVNDIIMPAVSMLTGGVMMSLTREVEILPSLCPRFPCSPAAWTSPTGRSF